MDPMAHLYQKLNAETIHQFLRQQPTPPLTAPPPYTPSETSTDSDQDSSDDDEETETAATPLKLTINAAHSIQGSNNLVPTSPTPLADATRFGTILLAAVNQINRSAAEASLSKAGRGLKVDLTINCGITVIGDRNVIGFVGLKQKAPAQAVAGSGAAMSGSPNAVAGAKRKVEDDDVDEVREAKRVAVPRRASE